MPFDFDPQYSGGPDQWHFFSTRDFPEGSVVEVYGNHPVSREYQFLFRFNAPELIPAGTHCAYTPSKETVSYWLKGLPERTVLASTHPYITGYLDATFGKIKSWFRRRRS